MSRHRTGWMIAAAAAIAIAGPIDSGLADEAGIRTATLRPLPPKKPVAAERRSKAAGKRLAMARASPLPPRRPDWYGNPEVSFATWRAMFRPIALKAGITPATFGAAFRGVRPNLRIMQIDSRQPEFSRAIWSYLDGAVSARRISRGTAEAAARVEELAAIQKKYSVDFPIVLAIWGLESGYGRNFGSIPVIESLSTLAYHGRRRAFAQTQLIAALKILQARDITPGRMVGSWAGAMGHTQFIPTSFLDYAVDHDGDGRRDVWAEDAIDALASAANYLRRHGWTLGAPVLVEVRLPGGFDFRLADPKTRRTAEAWTALGVKPVEGKLPAGADVAILVPAGASGPAFATYPNFRVIRRYNNATSYALAVAHLAHRIRGGGSFVAAWPRRDRMLSRTEKKELQTRLTALGFDTQGADGRIGPNSREAVRAFQAAKGLVPDGYVTADLLRAVRAAAGG